MRDVPILDEEYMKRREQQEAMRNQLRAMKATMNSLVSAYSPPQDKKTKAREEYLDGKITLEVFEARLDAELGLLTLEQNERR